MHNRKVPTECMRMQPWLATTLFVMILKNDSEARSDT